MSQPYSSSIHAYDNCNIRYFFQTPITQIQTWTIITVTPNTVFAVLNNNGEGQSKLLARKMTMNIMRSNLRDKTGGKAASLSQHSGSQ